MILLGDIGNSYQKWALFDGGRLGPVGRVAHDDADGLGRLLAIYRESGPSRTLVSSVGGAARNDLLSGALETARLPAGEFVATPPQGAGIRVGYDVPRELGCDRYLAMVAARRRYGGALIVVDCGTAVTLDAVEADGRHLGGAIVPGRRLMRDALLKGTAGVRFSTVSAKATYGRSTAEGVAIGTLHAQAGAVDALVERMSAGLGGTPTRVLTGGDAAVVEPLLKARYHNHPDLVLEGLAIHAGI